MDRYGAVDRERRNDGVDTRSVEEARVDHRARLVDAAADRAHDALDDAHQVAVVLEHRVDGFELAVFLDVDLIVAIDQDIGDVRVDQNRLERSESEQLVQDVADEAVALEQAERRRDRFLLEQRRDDAP